MNTTTRKTATTHKVTALVDANAPAKSPAVKPKYGFAKTGRYDHVREPDLTDFVDERAYWFTDHGMVVVPLHMLGTFRQWMGCSGLTVPPKGLYRFVGTLDLSWGHLKQIVNTPGHQG